MVSRNRDVTRRMNFFDRQFLRAQDFADEQDYHLDRRHRHNRLLHNPGIAEGLEVTTPTNPTTVQIDTGTAIDELGREIILLESHELTISADTTI